MTVSRVINQRSGVRDQTRTRVLVAMCGLDDQPNVAAPALVTGRSETVGAVTCVRRDAHRRPHRDRAARGLLVVISKTILGRHVYVVGGSEKARDPLRCGDRGHNLLGVGEQGRQVRTRGDRGRLHQRGAMSGGAGAVIGAVIGAIIGGFVMGVMRNGMSLVGVVVDWQHASLGMMVLPLAIAFDVRNEYKSAS